MYSTMLEYVAKLAPVDTVTLFIGLEKTFIQFGYRDYIQDVDNVLGREFADSNELLDDINFTYEKHLQHVLGEHGVLLDKTQPMTLWDQYRILGGIQELIYGDVIDVVEHVLTDVEDAREAFIQLIEMLTEVDYGRLQDMVDSVDVGIIKLLREFYLEDWVDEEAIREDMEQKRQQIRAYVHDTSLFAYQYLLQRSRLPIDFSFTVKRLADTLREIKPFPLLADNLMVLALAGEVEEPLSAISDALDTIFGPEKAIAVRSTLIRYLEGQHSEKV